MKRLVLMAAVLALAACGRPDEDDYEETVYDRSNPPAAQPNTGTGTGTAGARGTTTTMQRDSILRDSLRADSLRRDSLRRGTTMRRDTMTRRDTTP